MDKHYQENIIYKRINFKKLKISYFCNAAWGSVIDATTSVPSCCSNLRLHNVLWSESTWPLSSVAEVVPSPQSTSP